MGRGDCEAEARGPIQLGARLKPVVERTIVDDLRRRGARVSLAAPPRSERR